MSTSREEKTVFVRKYERIRNAQQEHVDQHWRSPPSR